MRYRRLGSLFAVTCSLFALFLAFGALPAQADCPGNAVANGNFEGGFSARGAGEVEVANGWHPWWQEGPYQDEGLNKRPEYKPEDASRYGRRRVREGNFSQKWFNTYATHHAGILQQINVPASSLVTASAWVQAWSSSKSDADVSVGGKYGTRVGIDPTGGTDWRSDNIVWSAENFALDQWVNLNVQAQAKGNTVTIYLRGDAEWPLKHNDVYFDDVCVTFVAPTPLPTKPPRPTNTPTVTLTPTATPTLTPSPLPTASPAPTDTPAPTVTPSPTATCTPVPATIRVLAFDDRDGSGTRDPGEELLAGARIDLLNPQRTPIASHLTDGISEPYSFGGLEPGSYVVVEEDPPGHESTSPNQLGAAVLAGSQLDLTFADRFAPSPTLTAKPRPTLAARPPTEQPPTATPRPVEEERATGPLSQWIHSVSGLLVAVVALTLPIVFRYLRGRL